MNLSNFIVKKIIGKTNGSLAKPAVNIATTAVALSVGVMIMSICVIKGFKNEIRNKIIGFDSHIQITHFSESNSYESSKINLEENLLNQINSMNSISHINTFATKAGILKNKEDIHGVVLKGIDRNYDFSFFKRHLVKGKIPDFEENKDKVLISNSVANLYQLEINDKVAIYFIQEPPRVRKFTISGIYETGFSEYDDLFIIGNLNHIRKLNGWTTDESGGIEIFVKDIDKIEEVSREIYNKTGYNLKTSTVYDMNPQIFNWLELQDINVIVIILVMLLVACVNMITTLFILVMERTQFIGILKAIGLRNYQLRIIFLKYATTIILKGILIGNIIGLSLCFIQKKFKLIGLDKASYYISHVPVELSFNDIILINIGTILICTVALMFPSNIISKINPIKAIKFD